MPEKVKPAAPEVVKLPALGSSGFLSRKDAARFLCESVQQIDKWSASGHILPYRAGRKVIFCKAELVWRLATGRLPVMPRPRKKEEKQKRAKNEVQP